MKGNLVCFIKGALFGCKGSLVGCQKIDMRLKVFKLCMMFQVWLKVFEVVANVSFVGLVPRGAGSLKRVACNLCPMGSNLGPWDQNWVPFLSLIP